MPTWLVHLEECEPGDSTEKTMSGHDESVEVISKQICDCGEMYMGNCRIKLQIGVPKFSILKLE